MKNLLPLSIVVSAIVLSYGWVRTENIKSERAVESALSKKLWDADMQLKTEECLNQVEIDYLTSWNNSCYTLGREDNCLLPDYMAESVEKFRDDATKTCLAKFK